MRKIRKTILFVSVKHEHQKFMGIKQFNSILYDTAIRDGGFLNSSLKR
jgi:hypothetical protein